MNYTSELPFLSEKKIVIFDFDGVLVDSVEVKTEAFADLYTEFGNAVVERVIDHHRTHGGVTRFDKFRYYHQAFLGKLISDQELQEMSERFSSIVIDKVVSSPEIPGASRFISQCRNHGLECAVNSATPEEEVREIVERRGWSPFFCAVLGSPSAKSENLRKLIRNINIAGDDAVFFGDSSSDLHAATECSIDFVGVGPWMIERYGCDGEFAIIKDYLGLL